MRMNWTTIWTDISSAFGQSTDSVTAAMNSGAMALVLISLAVFVLLLIIVGVLCGALARSKGYSFFGNFVLGFFFGVAALIYEAGRPISYERECVMQDRLALQTAKELYKLQRAREKAAVKPTGEH